MKTTLPRRFGFAVLIVIGLFTLTAHAGPVSGWLSWRGPQQNGSSQETGLPDNIAAKDALWVGDFPGQSTPVIANGKLYIMGYQGEGPELREGVACLNAETGETLWQHLFTDFISDTIYLRYATASPAIDPETGNVYIQCTQGILAGFTSNGKMLWQHSMMEEFGRLTFPNARTATPLIEGDLVIAHGITANWGAQGPAGDRFYAFDKRTGELVWTSSPGERPKDNSYSHPYVSWLGNRRVFFGAIGDGSVVCVNARTGDPLWRVPLAKAGINATVVVHNNDKVIAVYGTPYEPGQMVALKISNVAPTNPAAGAVVIDRSKVQLWADDLSTSSSSPILGGDTVYIVVEKGDLCAVDANTGAIKWKLKLGVEERNSCPLYADGKLYVPILDDSETKADTGEAGTTGGFYVIKTGDQPEILSHTALDGRCFGTPVAYNGKIYLQTAKHLYCWGKKGNNPGLPPAAKEPIYASSGGPQLLQMIPAEVTLRPGQSAKFRGRMLDAIGTKFDEIRDMKSVQWTNYIPPTAKVRSLMKGSFNTNGVLVAATNPVPSAGAFQATYQFKVPAKSSTNMEPFGPELKSYIRARVLPYLPLHEDFESFNLTETNVADGMLFAYPPLPWIGARFKFEVRERDGSKVLAKAIDNAFFARAYVFIGAPDAKNYTIEADVMSDGNKRKMSEVGVINQRYLIELKGNEQRLEVSSNLERLREGVDFKWQPNVWYHLKSRVDVTMDGTGMVRAKAWKRGEPEPEAWTLEVMHRMAHENGSPGLFGFSPQAERVYIDNVSVTAN